ncbi:MAG: radical SAM protein [Proteobacteria bacterium]|nr:radical SAM protein [Pseudomonadota bacterium]
MEIIYTTGDDDLARVFVAALDDKSKIEFVESVQPPFSREEKWVLIVSTLKGCPVGCLFCDAGHEYRGKLSKEEILAQIEHLILRRYPDGHVPVPKLKIQFARMGEPALNPAVLEVLEELPRRFDLPGLIPSISTVAPIGQDRFFKELTRIKRERFSGGRFQMQFSVHSTDEKARRKLVPIQTLSLGQMAALGDSFFEPGDRKVTLNFAAASGLPLEPDKLTPLFSPDRFLIKLTPINPTLAAGRSGIQGLIDPADDAACSEVANRFQAAGYDTILSIGELKENVIGSNCGMYVTRMIKEWQAEACA